MPVIKAGTSRDGNVKGADHGASISLILDESDPGQGPRLHRHPATRRGSCRRDNLTFQSGEEHFAIDAGDIVIIPAGVAHKFTNDGPSRSKLVCIHASPTFSGERLE